MCNNLCFIIGCFLIVLVVTFFAVFFAFFTRRFGVVLGRLIAEAGFLIISFFFDKGVLYPCSTFT